MMQIQTDFLNYVKCIGLMSIKWGCFQCSYWL